MGAAVETVLFTGALTVNDCTLMGVKFTRDGSFWAVAVLTIAVVRLPDATADVKSALASAYKALADAEQLPAHGDETSVENSMLVSVV